MSSFEEKFSKLTSSFLNENFVNPVVDHIVEKYNENREDVMNTITELLNIPVTTQPVVVQTTTSAARPVNGLAATAPTVVNTFPATLGTITAKPDAKKKTSKKDINPPANLTIEEYKEVIAKDGKVCGYLSNRAPKDQPEKSNRVCASALNDDECSDPDYRQWRCKSCLGKKGCIEQHIKNAVTGIEPTKAIAGFNFPILNSGKSSPAIIPTVPAPSELPPVPTMNVKETVVSPVKNETSKTLEIPEAPAPVVVKAESPKPVVAIPLPPQEEVKPKALSPVVPKLALARLSGLKDNDFIASNEDLKNYIIRVKYNGPTPSAEVIGKISNLSNPAQSDYEQKLEEISESEVENVKRYRVLYNYLKPVVMPLPNFELPGIPGLPPIPGIPGL
jgi:hypothetical protein